MTAASPRVGQFSELNATVDAAYPAELVNMSIRVRP